MDEYVLKVEPFASQGCSSILSTADLVFDKSLAVVVYGSRKVTRASAKQLADFKIALVEGQLES